MKRCPDCGRNYNDDSMSFCLDDGSELLFGPASTDEGATAIIRLGAGGEPRDHGRATHEKHSFCEKRALKPVAAVIIASVILVVGFFGYRYLSPPNSKQIESIAVMPFVNESGNADVEYLSDGMTETLISSLSQLPNLNVKPRSSVFRYKGKESDLQAIGRDLGVQAVLNGRVSQRNQDMSLFVELIDVTQNKVVWSQQYNRKITDLLVLQGEIARDVSDNLRHKLNATDEQKVSRKYTENAEAYALYLKGRYYWDKRSEESYRVAIDAYEQAIALDPNYALAYAGIADCYLFRDPTPGRRVAMPKAKEYALKALAMDDTLAEAHTTLAFVTMNYELNFAEGEKEFRRAIDLKPNYAIAHQFFGAMLVALGRTEEGLAEMRKAVDLEPYTATINWSLGMGLTFARRYDEALAQVERSLQLNPGHPLLEGQLAGLYVEKGRYEEALAIMRKWQTNSERSLDARSSIAQIYIKMGSPAEARKILKDLVGDPQQNSNKPYKIAGLYAALGETDEAIRWLNKAYEERAFNMFFLRVDRVFDNLHGDARFEDLVRRIGLSR